MKKKTADCNRILHQICENLDQDLNSAECRDIRKHVEKCTDCSAYLESMKTTAYLYRAYPVPSISKKKLTKLERLVLGTK